MSHRSLSTLVLALSCLGLSAQGIFNNADKPGDPICPRIMKDKTSLEFNSQYGANKAASSALAYHQQGDYLIPKAERRDVSLFTAYDERSKGTSIASLKGKVVLVGLWSKNCDPSAKMLMELATLYPKRAQFNFEILAVNFDENQQDGGGIEGGWRAINKFKISNREFFDSSQMVVYTPGLGKEGPSNFMEMVWSLPVLFLVDQDGKLAEVHIGYKTGFVGETLKRGVRERMAAAAAAPAGPAKQ